MGTEITPMDVVFSFDTTGSMSQALDEVKARVMDIIQKLQADIPGVRVGIIAHGDYCDKEHFYDMRALDLSDQVADVVTFVNDTEGTGGGDVPECYELALQRAKNMAWRVMGKRILVMIGDAYPHEPDYPLNEQNIDWRNELADLVALNVHIYGVQVENDELSTQFFKELATATEGQHLQLENMGRICEVIMGICYREQGPLMFQNFEAEIRNKEPEKFGADLECVFGTLRHEVSRTSDITTILDRDVDESDMDDFNDGCDNVRRNRKPRLKRSVYNDNNDEDDDVVKGNGKSKLKRLRFSQVFNSDDSDNDNGGKGNGKANPSGNTFDLAIFGDSDDDDDYHPESDPLSPFSSESDDSVHWSSSGSSDDAGDDDDVKGNGKPSLKRLRTIDLDSDDDDSQVPTKKRKTTPGHTQGLAQKVKKIIKGARKHLKKQPCKSKSTTNRKSRTPSDSSNSRKLYREHVPLSSFKWEPFSWSPWHMAVCPKEEERLLSRLIGKWKWKALTGDNSLWCTDLLKSIPATRGCSMMIELAIQAPKSSKKKVVSYHITKGGVGRGVLSLPWYRGVFRSSRPLLNRASQNCKIFLRWARVKTRSLKNCQKVVNQYNYAWKAQPPRLCF